MKLIIGLGNPGKEYEKTRHNIGREVVCTFAQNIGSVHVQKKMFAEIVKGVMHDEDVIAALPTTFMNESGRAVHALTTNYKLRTTDLLIAHDDLDLPLGTLRFTKNSGAAGQKGVQSIIDALGTKDIVRLRIGVAGVRRRTTDAAAYVLKKFSADERIVVAEIKQRAGEALVDWLMHGLAHAMRTYN